MMMLTFACIDIVCYFNDGAGLSFYICFFPAMKKEHSPIVRVKDKVFRLSIPASELHAATYIMAERLNKTYVGRNPLFVIVLNGAFIFASDLIRKISIDCQVEFVKLSSYTGTGSSGKVRKLIGLSDELQGRDVVIVEDIIDTGLSMEFLLEEIQRLNPSSVALATLLFKPDAFMKSYEIDYIGLSIPNEFIVGYGLDYDGYGRNLSDIYTLVPQED
jgi:hypoxanthine phosphoribosyltransferase